MTTNSASPLPVLTPEAVYGFLRNNPDFFKRHPGLLADLTLPHETGRAISLIERQVAVLRERNAALKHKLAGLVTNARENDRLFERTKRLVLNLLDCQDGADLVEATVVNLQQEFAIPFAAIVLVEGSAGNARRLTAADAKVLREYLNAGGPVSGRLPRAALERIFAQDAAQVQSAAVAPLGISLSLIHI